MLPATGNPPRDVAAMLRAHAAGASPDGQLAGIGAQVLSGGRNNAVYRWESPGGPICIKVYRVDDRQRAWREWLSLIFLAAHRAGSAPLPCGPTRTPDSPLSA